MKARTARVRAAIGLMSGDVFEIFTSELLKITHGFDKIEPSFNFMGKTITGKCDAYVYNSGDDTYVAIVCTTKQDYNRDKIIGDIRKLSSTKFCSKIRTVILCVNTPIGDEVELYRAECSAHGWKFEPLSLQSIVSYAENHIQQLNDFFNEDFPAQAHERLGLGRRFDCGPRLKFAREDVSILPSQLIELINFHSEREWNAIEQGHLEVSEVYISRISELTGVDPQWVKHGVGVKYPRKSIYDYNVDDISKIARNKPKSSYMLIDPESMAAALIVSITDIRWEAFTFGFTMDFWNWMGDEHHIPMIFDLLKKIRDELKSPYGRVVSREVIDKIRRGDTHPSRVIGATGSMNYWFDDVFDVNYNYPIAKNQYRGYGEWFVKLQSYFRTYERSP